MTRHGLTVTGLLLLFAMVALAQEHDTPLLPQQLGNWTRQSYEEHPANVSWGAILDEYGSLRAASAVYVRNGITHPVTVHKMRDGVRAYGAETFYRGRRGREGQTFERMGEFLISYRLRASRDLYGALTAHLTPLQGRQMRPPALPEYLPAKRLISGSERFLMGPAALETFMPLAVGDWVGFSYGAEAEYAEYRLDSGRTQFVILSYPTPQIALARMEEMSSVFNLNGQGRAGRPIVHILREGTLLFLATGSDLRADEANELLTSHRYRRDLAITKTQPELTQEEWLSLVGSVFVNTGVLTMIVMLLAVVLGGGPDACQSSMAWPGLRSTGGNRNYPARPSPQAHPGDNP